MRRLAARDLDAWMDELGADVAVRTSHPAWVVTELERALDRPDELAALLAADNERAARHPRARPGLSTTEELLDATGGQPLATSPLAWTLDAGDPGGVAAVREGRAGVQDAGSQLVALALARAAVEGATSGGSTCAPAPGARPPSSPRWPTGRAPAARPRAPAAPRAARPPGAAGHRRRRRRRRRHPAVVAHPARSTGPWSTTPRARAGGAAPPPGEPVAPPALRRRRAGHPPAGPARRGAGRRASRRGGRLRDLLARRRRDRGRRHPGAGRPRRRGPRGRGPARARGGDATSAHLAGAVQLWPHRHGTDAMFLALLRRR